MNSVIIIGRLTKDPELRYVQGSGNAVCQFTLAVNKKLSKDKKAEFESKGKPTADFPRIVAWGKLAENVTKYTGKGRLVAVKGSIQTSTHQDKNGETRYSTDIFAENIEFLEWGEKKQQTNQNSQNDQTPNWVVDDGDLPF